MTTRSLFKRGQRVFFHYTCFESDKSADAELWHHTDQFSVVVKRISDCDESEVGQMYVLRFSDGFEYDVFASEMFEDENQWIKEKIELERLKERRRELMAMEKAEKDEEYKMDIDFALYREYHK